MDTRQRILREALRLFSQRGYDAVSVEQIAEAVGIKAPSLYKHYKGKQDIFDAVFAETARRYDAFTDNISVHLGNTAEDLDTLRCLNAEDLVRKVRSLVAYSLHDDFISQFRRMMTIEQFRSPQLSALYSERYVAQIQRYHTGLFTRMISLGVLRDEDPQLLALIYDAPILLMLGECDRHPEMEEEAMRQLEAHVRLFYRTYRRNPGSPDPHTAQERKDIH